MGDAVALTALVLRVEATVGVGVAVSGLLLAHAVPNSFLGPIAGSIADRVDQRLLMVGADVGRALVFVVIAATLPSFPVLIALMVVVAVLETGFRPAGRSTIPTLVAKEQLMTANAWMVSALNAGAALGPLIGGVLVASIGFSGALYANAASFLISAAFLIGLPRVRVEQEEGERLGFFATTREGLAFAARDRMMRAIMIGMVFGVAAGGLDNIALVFMARRVFEAGPTGFGALESAFGIGMIVASLLLVKRQPFTSSVLFALGWFGTALGNFGVGIAPVISVALLAQFAGGAGNGICLVGGDTLIQERVPKHMLGRALGVTGSAPFIGMLIAYGSGGFLVDAFGARSTFLISGTASLIVAIGVALMLRRVNRA
jgi:MFS family permease